MSGSGATCFGIVADQAAALALAQRLRAAEPGWWVAPARVRDWSGMAPDEGWIPAR
ncbi:MAG: 4-(cytidine 5'-diphospho)-2-C-methyl-D-erythritol kinase, partial [Alphaproteobacteria bacterium HGW-Alphaproteobacteria-8]